MVHGDDFTAAGGSDELDWFKEQMENRFKGCIKMRGKLGWSEGDDKSIRILNRVVTCTEQGLEYEADQRHAEIR